MAAALIPFLITACSGIAQTEADNWTELCKARLDKSMCQADSEFSAFCPRSLLVRGLFLAGLSGWLVVLNRCKERFALL